MVAGADASRASVHAFDRLTGQPRWARDAGRGVNGPIAGAGRYAYAATLGGELTAFDIESGKVVWTAQLEVPGFEGPAASIDRVFVGTVDGSLHRLSGASGSEDWHVMLGAPITTSVSAAGNDVYVGLSDGTVSRIDARQGTVLGTLQPEPTLIPRSVPVVMDDAVLVLLTNAGADYRMLVSVDRTLQHVRWRQAAPKNWSTSRAFVSHRSVVLGTPDGEVTAYCLTDGSQAWSRNIGGRIRAIGGADDMLYIGTSDGHLSALRAPAVCMTR